MMRARKVGSTVQSSKAKRTEPPTIMRLYYGVFKEGSYVGSCWLSYEQRQTLRRGGFGLMLWDYYPLNFTPT